MSSHWELLSTFLAITRWLDGIAAAATTWHRNDKLWFAMVWCIDIVHQWWELLKVHSSFEMQKYESVKFKLRLDDTPPFCWRVFLSTSLSASVSVTETFPFSLYEIIIYSPIRLFVHFFGHLHCTQSILKHVEIQRYLGFFIVMTIGREYAWYKNIPTCAQKCRQYQNSNCVQWCNKEVIQHTYISNTDRTLILQVISSK